MSLRRLETSLQWGPVCFLTVSETCLLPAFDTGDATGACQRLLGSGRATLLRRLRLARWFGGGRLARCPPIGFSECPRPVSSIQSGRWWRTPPVRPSRVGFVSDPHLRNTASEGDWCASRSLVGRDLVVS